MIIIYLNTFLVDSQNPSHTQEGAITESWIGEKQLVLKTDIITNKNNNKFQFKRKNSNNQSHNVITDQTRNANVDGNPPKYSNQRHNFNDTNVNSEEQSNNKINSIWLFTKISGTTDINPRMYVLRRYATNVVIPDTDDFGNDSETFEWKYNNHYII